MSSGDSGSSKKNSLNCSTSLRELDGLGRRDALMNVVKQFDFFAKLLPAFLEQIQRAADVGSRLEHRARMQRSDLRVAAAGAIAGHAGDADLHADVAEALLHELACACR